MSKKDTALSKTGVAPTPVHVHGVSLPTIHEPPKANQYITVYENDPGLAEQVIELSHRVYELEQTTERLTGENEAFRGYFLLCGMMTALVVVLSIAVSHQSRVYYPAPVQPSINRGA